MAWLPDNFKILVAAVITSLVLACLIPAPVGGIERTALEDIMSTGDKRLIISTNNERILQVLQWLTISIPEAFTGLPKTTVWTARAANLADTTYAIASPYDNTIQLNFIDHPNLTSGDLRTIMLHEITHAKLFAQGVTGSLCARVYHELYAYAYEIGYYQITKPSTNLRASTIYGYEASNYEYRARYCNTWFAPVPSYGRREVSP